MTPEELIAHEREQGDGECSGRWCDGFTIMEELDRDSIADAIGVLLERCDKLERLVREFRSRERDEMDEQRNVLEGFHWAAEDRRRFLADWDAETERILKGGDE